jgi:hypothetical protein
MYYNIEENKKINNSLEFRELFPNILFPKILTDEIMEEYGYKKVIVNEATSTLFTEVVDSKIEVINGIPTINQSLVYKPLYECKEIALNTIKTKREDSIIEPINNIQVFTLQDRENIQGSIDYFEILSQGKGTITWTMDDNTEQDLSLEDLKGALDAYVIRKSRAFAEYQIKKELIANATTAEEIEESVWLDEIQKIKDENKPKTETSNES